MEVFRDRTALSAWLSQSREAGARIGFVPTMGALHSGHLALLEAARKSTDRTVVSIFVNPTQFGPKEDFAEYPRTFDLDKELLLKAGCDAVFCPSVETIYAKGFQSLVSVEPLGSDLCGRSRPGHFRGVATVVMVLLNLVRPDQAFFGLKDYQQFVLIRRFVEDLRVPVEIRGVATVREESGLALSSRNVRLSEEERVRASSLFRALSAAKTARQAGENNPERLIGIARRILGESGIHRIDYIVVRNADTLAPLEKVFVDPVMLMAVQVGAVRLIDNMVLALER